MRLFLAGFLAVASCVVPSIVSAKVTFVPALYKVTNVASNDSLNVRQNPDASSPILGTFAHNQTGIEVITISENESWALVNIQGQSGWASARYLSIMAGQPAENLPVGMACSGTEPFWNLDFETAATATGDWSFMGLSSGPTQYSSLWTGSPVNRMPSNYGFILNDITNPATGFIELGLCSDGMSDLSFSHSISVILGHDGHRIMFTGCCSLATPEY